METTGGLKLKNVGGTKFTPVFNMLNSSNAKLNLLTYSSLKGFLFVLTVDESAAEYADYTQSKFTKNVTCYLLKIAVISPRNDEVLPEYIRVTKCTESEDSYFDEAKLQQTIWNTSISTGGKTQTCPSVANFSIFDNKQSVALLEFLICKSSSPKTTHVFMYLLDQCITPNSDYNTGIIVMPFIDKSETFFHFEFAQNEHTLAKTHPNKKFTQRTRETAILAGENTDVYNAYVDAMAELIRLFTDIGVIHFDAHPMNILVFRKESKLKSVIIDFGRASNLLDNKADDYLDARQKTQLAEIKKQFYNEFFVIRKGGSDKEKSEFISRVMKKYQDTDYEKNLEKFMGIESAQMSWLWDYVDNKPNTQIKNIFLAKVFDKLEILLTVISDTGVKTANIKKMIKDGHMFDVNGRVTDFYEDFESLIGVVTPGQGKKTPPQDFCTVSGGKKKTRKKRRRTR
jgi:hypothetical protein